MTYLNPTQPETEYNRFFDISLDLFCIATFDGYFKQLNPAWEKTLGFTMEELKSKSLIEFIHPEDRTYTREITRDAVLNKVSSLAFENRFLCKDGSFRWLLWNAVPLADKKLTYAVAHDITSQKKALQQLRESEARYRAVSELTSDYIYGMRLTPDGELELEWVTEALYTASGYSKEELDKMGGWVALIHPDDLLLVNQGMQNILNGQAVVNEFRIITKSGEIQWRLNFGQPEWDETSQKIIGALGAAQDITERKLAEEQRLALERNLLETQKLKSLGLMAGGIAHDFNNLLAAILGNAGLALLELPDDSPVRETIQQIELAAEKAAELTRNMLAYSGKGAFMLQAVNLSDLVQGIAHLFKATVQRNVSLVYQLAPDLPNIKGDITQLHQALINLVVNASEAIGDQPGEIKITTASQDLDRNELIQTEFGIELPEGPYVYIEITDNGSGIAEKDLPRIFDPYFSTKFTGRGLGLAAVYGIIKGHQATLKVSSLPGQGTTFCLFFPASPDEDQFQASPVPDLVEERSKSDKILLIEDDASVRTVVARMLEKTFKVEAVENPLQGVEIYRSQPNEFACVLLDMTMPQLSGEQVVGELRRINPEARIILMSGYSKQDFNYQSHGLEPENFLAKPFTAAQLHEKIYKVLSKEK